MRELILLRHAHAESAMPGQDDRDRALSVRGRTEAAAAGQWLRAHGYAPDRALCSPARRARETLDLAQDAIGACETVRVDGIYEATPGALIALADAHRDAQRLLMVGHNPGFEHFTALMSTGQSGDFRGMHTAGIAVLHLPGDAAIEPGIARLVAYWMP
ncbi:MAG: histidine phosphatase family protein [Proteobacteria bacterium]|nr:histidine phosphatase family protein [Pseudomonadota bacterium]MBS0463381.1 histidine phosphatase family protein [Pseudomonadota bacterium]